MNNFLVFHIRAGSFYSIQLQRQIHCKEYKKQTGLKFQSTILLMVVYKIPDQLTNKAN